MTMQVAKTLQSSTRRDKRRGSTRASFVSAKTDSIPLRFKSHWETLWEEQRRRKTSSCLFPPRHFVIGDVEYSSPLLRNLPLVLRRTHDPDGI